MKQKIIIDTDCGSDDAMAIAMAMNDTKYEVLMISTVAGIKQLIILCSH